MDYIYISLFFASEAAHTQYTIDATLDLLTYFFTYVDFRSVVLYFYVVYF